MELPKRKRNRLPYYDYSSQGAYFVTICTELRKNTLCTIVGDGLPVPKPYGKTVEQYVHNIPKQFPGVRVDHYVIMPNHIHLLLIFESADGTGNPSPTLGSVIGWYKYNVTKDIHLHHGEPGKRIFQRSYHDHVIRNERDYQRIWNYIEGNPARWTEDCFYAEEESIS